jgi:hypothetical protein
MTQTGKYTVNAKDVIEYAIQYAKTYDDHERGIWMLQIAFGMSRIVAEELFYGNLKAICQDNQILELRRVNGG